MTPDDKAVRIREVRTYYLPVRTRTPYRFGNQSLDKVTCLRVGMRVEAAGGGRTATGWGETPLSIPWAWPGGDFQARHDAVLDLCASFRTELACFPVTGHPLEIMTAFQEAHLHRLRKAGEGIPYLPALVSLSAFDLALYDAFGVLHGVPVFEALGGEWMSRDLGSFLETDPGTARNPFSGKFPQAYLKSPREERLPAWHSVGAGDRLEPAELDGTEPQDGYPNTLVDWIKRDGLTCLKIKLTGQDFDGDLQRIIGVGRIAGDHGCDWLCTDYNSTVKDVGYVTEMLDRLERDYAETWRRILYVEQPFPYEMEESPPDVTAVSRRKPLYMDESAHDWKLVREGRQRGWTGVALKTCKTLTNALLMLAWAREHGMPLMVQDLTNPRLAQVTHALLAAHAGTVMGLETNSMQFYPEASIREEAVHPGLFRRRNGVLDLSTVSGPGFGYGPVTSFHVTC